MIKKDEDDSLEFLKLPSKPTTIITFLDRNGELCEEEGRSVAKCVENFSGYSDSSIHYFIRFGNGEVLDPHEAHSHLNQNRLKRFKFRKVKSRAWDEYSKYLSNKERKYFTNARRLIME
jgi:hypothetical protein